MLKMTDNKEALYAERLNRYVTAMRNGKPGRVPIRPFVAEFTAKYAGYTCQEVAHDFPRVTEQALRCLARNLLSRNSEAVLPVMRVRSVILVMSCESMKICQPWARVLM
jgi:hypothetical protein